MFALIEAPVEFEICVTSSSCVHAFLFSELAYFLPLLRLKPSIRTNALFGPYMISPGRKYEKRSSVDGVPALLISSLNTPHQ
jgi:hypothetical protein